MKMGAIRKSYANILFSALIFSMLIILASGCSSDDEKETELVGNWIELSDFEGVPRSDAVAFVVNGKAYVGTGYDGEDRLNDFWEYDPVVNNWTKKADFPGTPRNGAVGFGTDTKGYVGTGYDGTNKLNDFWEYDPATDTWDSVATFEGSARYGAVAFSINNLGYVATGYDGNTLKDLWEYDPAADAWTQKISLGGGKRRDAVAFVVNGKGYITTGIDNGIYEDDLWEYDPTTNTWDGKRDIANVSDSEYDDDYSNIKGTNKVGFAVGGKGYVSTGGQGTAGKVTWEYNPATDLWVQRTSLEASGRIDAVGFAIDDLGYVVSGRNGSFYFDDLWGFYPTAAQVDLDKPLGNLLMN